MFIVNYANKAPGTILGRNIRILSSKMNKTYQEMVDMSAPKVREFLFDLWSREVYEEYILRAEVIKELLLVKEDLLFIDFGFHRMMDIISCDFIVNNLCVF